MSSYDLVIANARAFSGESYAEVLREIADFAEEAERRVILGVNIQDNFEEGSPRLTAYVMYES